MASSPPAGCPRCTTDLARGWHLVLLLGRLLPLLPTRLRRHGDVRLGLLSLQANVARRARTTSSLLVPWAHLDHAHTASALHTTLHASREYLRRPVQRPK